MLVVTRKTKESLMIGDNIEVVVLECKDGSVKIGIKAPGNVKVYRKEIFDEIRSQNSKALDIDINTFRKIMEKE